jgi:hypothetical protein
VAAAHEFTTVLEDKMGTKTVSAIFVLSATIGIVHMASRPAAAEPDKLKAEDIVAKHLDSIGNEQARSALKTMLVEGNLRVRFLMGGSGEAGGPFSMISTGQKLILQSKFEIPNYPGESFAFDGEKKSIGSISPGQRSQLEDFLNHYGEVVQDGLIGGTLSTAWPLYDWKDRKAKLDSDGLKKIDGKELYRITYHARHGSGDLKIYIFFDPENFRHVKTIYTMQTQPGMGVTPGASSGGGLARITLEENFGGFARVGDLMLPSQWMLKYSQEGVGNGSSIIEYDMGVSKIEPGADVTGRVFRLEE